MIDNTFGNEIAEHKWTVARNIEKRTSLTEFTPGNVSVEFAADCQGLQVVDCFMCNQLDIWEVLLRCFWKSQFYHLVPGQGRVC